MALVIPNTTDTTGGEEFASFDQAEPDSLDFEIAGNTGVSGVLSGCEVTTNNSNLNVNVSAGDVVVSGVSYPLAANSVLALPTAPSDTRFDLVVARESGGSVSLVVVQGPESATNPVYPQSTSVFGGAYDSTIHVDFDHDVVLAALLREGSAVVSSKEITDKRTMVSSTVMWQGTSLPASAPNGTMFFLTNEVTAGAGVTVSGLYVRANGAWLPVAQSNTSVGVPIGASFFHNGTTPPEGALVEDGSAVSRSTYAALFSVIGTTFGDGDGSTTFNLPNSIGRFFRGSSSNIGNTGGADNRTLSTSNMPRHRHGLNDHTHPHSHTHNVDHGHTASSSGAFHTHHVALSTDTQGVHTHDLYPRQYVNTGDFSPGGTNVTSRSAVGNQEVVTPLDGTGNHWHNVVGDTEGASSGHSHPVSDYNGNTKGASSTNTSGPNQSNTTYTGDGSSFDNRPAFINKLPCIRAL